MATTFQFALSNPVAGQEDVFNLWYGGDHLIHGVLTPGVAAGQRFRRAEGPWPSGRHDYLMLWEMDDPAFALAHLAAVKGSGKMPISPAIDMATVQPPTMWRRAKIFSAARVACDTTSRHNLVLGLYSAIDDDDAAFEHEMLSGGLATLADLPGVYCAEYLTLAEEQIRGNARKYRHGVLIELHDAPQAISALTTPLSRLPHADAERWLAAHFEPLAVRMTTKDAAALEHA